VICHNFYEVYAESERNVFVLVIESLKEVQNVEILCKRSCVAAAWDWLRGVARGLPTKPSQYCSMLTSPSPASPGTNLLTHEAVLGYEDCCLGCGTV
jgi:hypothetical protein